MDVLLLGASGQIGQRITDELLDRGHTATGVSRSGDWGVDDPDVFVPMTEAVLDGVARSEVDRLVWTGGAGGLEVEPGTKLIETEEFPDDLVPLARAHVDALDRIREADDVEWSYLTPPMIIEPGERTGEYRTAVGELVVDAGGDSHISMEDFAVAFVDELEAPDPVHTRLGIGY